MAQQENLRKHAIEIAREGIRREFERRIVVEARQEPARFGATIIGGFRTENGGAMIVRHHLNDMDFMPHLQDRSPDKLPPQSALDISYEVGRVMGRQLIAHMLRWREIAFGRFDTPKRILGLEDMEQRMAAVRVYGMEKFITESGALLLDRSEKGNELYVITDIFPMPAFYLRYKDPSTDRVYVSGIDPALFRNRTITKRRVPKPITVQAYHAGDDIAMPTTEFSEETDVSAFKGAADEAMAWKFNITLEQYGTLVPLENEA